MLILNEDCIADDPYTDWLPKEWYWSTSGAVTILPINWEKM